MINPKDYTVLLAEDSYLNENFVSQLFGKGFGVFLALNGLELFSIAKEKRNEKGVVILSDTDMPILCGDEACRRILEEFPEYRKRVIIGMSDDPSNEQYWEGIGIWNSFILKGADINNELDRSCLGNKFYSTLSHIIGNPKQYLLADGNFRRSLR